MYNMFFIGLRILFFNGKHTEAKGYGQFHLYLFLHDSHYDMSRLSLLLFLDFVHCHLFITKIRIQSFGARIDSRPEAE